MFDHVTIRVTDFEASKRFYSTVLAPLGASLGFYDDQRQIAEWGDFSIAADGKPVAQNVHVAFAARDNAAVDAFWQAGIDAGYVDNGAPGDGACTTPATTGPSCSIRMATTSKPSATTARRLRACRTTR